MGEQMSAVGTTVRPVPAVLPETEYFWRGGADGELRIQQCRGCNALQHPWQPICRVCRSRDLAVTVVSGRGVVVGLTVAVHGFDPLFPPPYAIATVALEEDSRVRIATNLVGADPSSTEVGLRVKVRFEQLEDVWITLFEPDTSRPAATPDELPEDPEVTEPWRFVRPMVTTDKYEHKGAITGIGMSQIGRRLGVPALQLTLDACDAALADAGLSYDDIDGLSSWPGMVPIGGFAEGGVIALDDALGIRANWHGGDGSGFGPAGSVVDAAMAIAAGLCRHVLCFRTVWQTTFADQLRRAGGENPYGIPRGEGRISGEQGYTQPYGLNSAAQVIALRASYHFKRYGTTRETLGWLAVNGRRNAALNPRAIYREPMSMDDYLSARMISTPFGLYDCDVPCDGAVAVIVSAVDAARDLAQPPIRIEAIGTQWTERPMSSMSTLSHLPQSVGPARHLWTRTHLTPDDVDIAELYDGFSFNTLSWLESLGFCGIGEAKDFLDGGHNIALHGGVLPLNTHGGQLSEGRTHGLGFVYEAVTQLRGQAGQRQVAGAEVAVVAAGGLTPAGCMILTTDR